MNLQTILFTSYELILAIVFGLFTIYICIKLLSLTFLHSDNNNYILEGKISTSIFAGAMIFSVMLLVSLSILPSVDALRTMVLGLNDIRLSFILISLGYFLVFYFITLFISLLILFLAIKIYMIATINIDEMAEIKQGNIGVSILISIILIAITLFIQPSVKRFIGSLVAYDTLENYQAAPLPPPLGKTIIPKSSTTEQP